MKLLEMMGLVGVGYILKDRGAFYPRRRYSSYGEKSPVERIKKTLGDKIADMVDGTLNGKRNPKPKRLKCNTAINYSRYFTDPVKRDSNSDCDFMDESDVDFINEITQTEYFNTHTEYLKIEITIYRDCVIAGNGEPLADRPENLIGEENYKRICENMWAYDWGTYYIRNDEERTDIELNVCDENYADSLEPKESEIETIEREDDNLF